MTENKEIIAYEVVPIYKGDFSGMAPAASERCCISDMQLNMRNRCGDYIHPTIFQALTNRHQSISKLIRPLRGDIIKEYTDYINELEKNND